MSETSKSRPDIGTIPELNGYQIKNTEWKKGVVVRSPNWLGDAVMTLPALLQLKKMLPDDCGLYIVSPPSLERFYESLAIIDTVVTLHQTHKLWRFSEVKALRTLQAGIGILFNNSLRDTVFFRLAGIPKLFGAAARGRGLLLTGSYRFPKRMDKVLNRFHHAAKYLSIAYAVGAPEWQYDMPEFNIPKPQTLGEKLLELAERPNLMAIAAGAAYGESKRWAADSFREVARYWIDTGGTVLVLGSTGEKPIGDQVVNGLPVDNAVNLAGETDLIELMYMLNQIEICVCNDSGIMHLAAALGLKGVAIFGSTDPTATAPVSANWKIMFEKQECAPCFTRECPKNTYACMRAVSTDQVIDAIKELC